MKILLLGADGFIGRHLDHALCTAGHCVVRGTHQPTGNGIAIDFRRTHDVTSWVPHLYGIDAVINTVGILSEKSPSDFDHIHRDAPTALAAACVHTGIQRLIHISALGAERADTPYLASKAAGEAGILAYLPSATLLRPSLVFGGDGASSRFFLSLASLPFAFMPAGGRQALQPIHIDDLVALILAVLHDECSAGKCIPAVGGRQVSYAEMIAIYRQHMHFLPALSCSIPAPLMGLAARLAEFIPGSLLKRSTWSMLQAGNTADAALITQYIGKPPRAPENFIATDQQSSLRHAALTRWRLPLLRLALATLWLYTAAVSLLWPATGLELLGNFALQGTAAWFALLGASALDASLGVLTLSTPSQRLWQLQIALIVFYSLLVAIRLPEYFIHPFAPIAKNILAIALLVQLWAEERRA